MRFSVVILALAGFLIPFPALAEEKVEKPTLVLDTGGHTARITKVLFTPDGKKLISVSEDKTIRIWDLDSRQAIRVLRPPIGSGLEGRLLAAALSPDGQTLAVAGCGKLVAEKLVCPIWLCSLGEEPIVRVLSGHEEQPPSDFIISVLDCAVTTLAFTSDGKRLASCTKKCVKIWNVERGKCERELRPESGEAQRGLGGDIALSPDGKTIVASPDLGNDEIARGGAELWATETGKVIARIKFAKAVHTSDCVAWSPNGQIIAIGDAPLVHLYSGKGAFLRDVRATGVRSLAFTPDSGQLIISGECIDENADAGSRENFSPLYSIVDLKTGTQRALTRRWTGAAARALAVSPDGKWIASADSGGIFLCKTAEAAGSERLKGQVQPIWSAAWAPDGSAVAWGSKKTEKGIYAKDSLQSSFSLARLDFDKKPDETYQRASLKMGKLSFNLRHTLTAVVMQGSQSLREFFFFGDEYTRVTFFRGERIIATKYGLTIYKVRKDADGLEDSGRQFYDCPVQAVAPSPDGRYLLAGGEDGTLRILDPDRKQPLILSLFFAGSEWIAWAPEGYYAASPAGEKLMGWHVNNGREAMARFYPAAQFNKTFYRPDVIKRLLAAGSAEKALAEADKARGTTTARVDLSQVLPPKVAITSPARSGTKITATRFEIKVAAHSPEQPVTSLCLLVDGRPYGGESSLRTVPNAKVGEIKESWQVELTPGTHRLAVVAASAVSQGLSEEIEVLIAPDSGPVKPPSASLHLMAVGINAYPGRMKLDCAAPDAKAVDQTFRTHGKGLYQVQSTVLLDKDATRAAILKGLDGLAKKAKIGDVAVFYYAGHGDCKITGQFQVLPVDVDVKKLAETGISGDELRGRLAKLPCTALLIMDCCYAGSFDATPKLKKRGLPTEAGDLVRELVSDDQGLVVMCGASKEQESGEEAKLGHGYFTLALTEGLAGKAASKRDGLVYLSGLQLYVEERVRELSNDEQYPTIGKPTLIRSFPLSKP